MHKEKTMNVISGWGILIALVVVLSGSIWMFINAIA